MVGAGIGASFAGWIRSSNGSYEIAWYAAGALCLLAAFVAMTIRKEAAVEPERVPVPT
jgi:cyanate permease